MFTSIGGRIRFFYVRKNFLRFSCSRMEGSPRFGHKGDFHFVRRDCVGYAVTIRKIEVKKYGRESIIFKGENKEGMHNREIPTVDLDCS